MIGERGQLERLLGGEEEMKLLMLSMDEGDAELLTGGGLNGEEREGDQFFG